MAIQTRLGQHGIGVRPYLGFVAKTAAPTGGPHPFADGTRLGQMAIGVRPASGFVAKAEVIVVEPEHPGAPRIDFPGGSRGGDITKLIMDKEKLLEDRIHAMDEDMLSMIVFAIEEGIIE